MLLSSATTPKCKCGRKCELTKIESFSKSKPVFMKQIIKINS